LNWNTLKDNCCIGNAHTYYRIQERDDKSKYEKINVKVKQSKIKDKTMALQ
jgi:hypothetical protein